MPDDPVFHPTSYSEVNAVLGLLLSEVRAILGEELVGMYLYGSLSMGAFEPGSSDIDFLVATVDALANERVSALRDMHARLITSGLSYATRLEGFYCHPTKEDILNRQKRKALIIGGGIAGPVAALLLQRAGIEAEIYEARDTPEDYASSWLVMACNGLDVLKTLELDDPVSAEGSPIPRMILSSGKGKRFGEVPNGARPEVGAPSMVVKRGTLNRILHEEAMRRGIKVAFGKKLHDLEMTGEQGVIATFADGTTAVGSFLIGCDGIHSRTRQLINPDAPPPEYTGMMSTGGFTRGLHLPPTSDTLHLVFGKRAFIGYHISSSGEISWFVTFPHTQEPGRSEVNEIGSDEWQQRMLDVLKEEQPFLSEMIGATDRITGYPIYDIPTQPVWHKGQVVIVGDAIHAVTPNAGQGASLAMEDAMVLAHCLRDIPEWERAFATYERLRRERVERVVQYGRSLGSWRVMTNPVQVWFWELLMPFFLKRSANPTALDWLYSYKVDWDATVEGTPDPVERQAAVNQNQPG